ncbi:MAG: hypothetical protein R2874_02960 [Desulfobacterales bacterium]
MAELAGRKSGRLARGRLVLGEHLEDIHTRVDVFEMDFSADYDRLPFPVHVNGGKTVIFGKSRSVLKMSTQVSAIRFFRSFWL